MEQVLLRKNLDDCVISLVKYQIHESTARALDRPVGSYEMVLRFDSGHFGAGSSPRASWFLKESDYVALFNKVNCKKDYFGVRGAIETVNSDDDAARLRKSL